MADTKQDTLNKLYALRAGLSVISENKDGVAAIKKTTDGQLDDIEHKLSEKFEKYVGECLHWDAKSTKDVKATLSHKGGIEQVVGTDTYGKILNECEEYKVKTRKDIDKNAKSDKRKLIFWSIFAPLMFLIVVADIVISVTHREWILNLVNGNDGWQAFITGVMGVVPFLLGVIGLFKIGYLIGDLKSHKNYSKSRAEHPDKFTQAEMLSYGEQALEQYRTCKQEANEVIKARVKVHNEAYNSLVETFGSFLDPRDWQYLDLIVYCFETNRADTLKEALQQLDRERQTQQIVGSIKLATKAICRTIQSEMSALRSTIETGFAGLQSSIDKGFAQMKGMQQAQLDELKLSNALRAKANTTSEQLLKDVQYMKSKLTY